MVTQPDNCPVSAVAWPGGPFDGPMSRGALPHAEELVGAKELGNKEETIDNLKSYETVVSDYFILYM